MSLLRAALAPVGDRRAITDLPWVEWAKGGPLPGRRTGANKTVNATTAMGVAALWRCMTLIADTVSALPVDVYRKQAGVRIPIEPEPGLVRRPSLLFTRREWVFQAVTSAVLWGNVYGLELTADTRGWPLVVEVVNPSKVTVTQVSSLRPAEYLIDGQKVDPALVHHLRRYPGPGSVVGICPLDTHRELIGTAIAARDYAAQWFGDGAHPSGLLTTDKDLDDPEGTKTKAVKERFLASVRGRQPVAMGGGWKYKAFQSSPSDSELVDTWNRIGVEVAQALGVPAEMVGFAAGGSSVTYANRDQRALDFLVYTMTPWLTMFEDWWTDNRPEGEFARFNVNALLRTDLATRFNAHQVAIRNGWASRNEIRALEDQPPIEGGDEYLWPPYRAFPLDSDKGDE